MIRRISELLAIVFIVVFLAAECHAVDATLSWTDNASNEDGFRVYRGLNKGPLTLLIEIIGANVQTFTDKTLVQDPMVDNAYCFDVSAFNTAGESLHSNQACKTVARGAPTGAPSNLTVK